MNISLVGRHVELTEAIKDHLNASIDTLNKYNLDIISVTAVASAQERKGKQRTSIEFTIHLAHQNSIVIKQSDDDLYAAVDIAIDRARKALRRMHDRIISNRDKMPDAAKAEAHGDINISEAKEAQEDEIVPLELDLYKPREAADVLEDLKEGNKQFEIFLDNSGKTRVLYKRSDGRFGLY